MSIQVDYILVGQGLAGSTLAFQLIKNNASVLVIDEEKTYTSSKIAAGMFTPVSGKRLTKTWMAEELLMALNETYSAIEIWTGEKFVYHQPIQQSFASVKDQNDFYATRSTQIESYLILNPTMHNGVHAPFGGFEIKQSGWINMAVFLSAVKSKLISIGSYYTHHFDVDELKITSTGCVYQNIQAKAIIFCQGFQNIHNPYFKHVSIIPNKGDVFLIETDAIDSSKIYKRGAYAVCVDHNLYKVGSTYKWNELNPQPTQLGYDELKHKTDSLINGSYQIINHVAGIRPTTTDRKPVLGKHPKLPLYIFNGLGAKGVMMAGYLSQTMANFILNQTAFSFNLSSDRFKHDSTQL